MYWTAVKQELEDIFFTLREWQGPKFDSVVQPDELDTHIHGFETFVDQVNESSRGFAERYGMSRGCFVMVQRRRTLHQQRFHSNLDVSGRWCSLTDYSSSTVIRRAA
jgi:hypothetical protein